MRVNRRIISLFFTDDRNVEDVVRSYGVDPKGDRETAREFIGMLYRDKDRFQRGIEVFTDNLDKIYTKFLNSRGYMNLAIVM